MTLSSHIRWRVRLLLLIACLCAFSSALPLRAAPLHDVIEGDQLIAVFREAVSVSADGSISLNSQILSAHNLSSADIALAERLTADFAAGSVAVRIHDGYHVILDTRRPGDTPLGDTDASVADSGGGIEDGGVWIFLDSWWCTQIRTHARAIEILTAYLTALLIGLLPTLPLPLRTAVVLFLNNIVAFVRYFVRLLLDQETAQSTRIDIKANLEPLITLFHDDAGRSAMLFCRQIGGCTFPTRLYLPVLRR